MSGRFQEAYTEIQNFITANPSIKISTNVVVINSDVRAEFYRLFDNVRAAFLEDKFAALRREAEILSENYLKAEQAVTKLLKLDNVLAMGHLQRFLHNPSAELHKGLTDPLFDLLKGKVGFETFEQQASENIKSTFGNFYGLGYAKWVALSLVQLLASDKLFNITPIDSDADGMGNAVHREKPIPSPEESKVLSFEYGPHQYPPFIMPNFIVHSAKLNRYVSFRTELWQSAVYTAIGVSEMRKWLSLDSISIREEYRRAAPDPSLLIYIDNDLEALALIADRDRICRPDMIVECREHKDWDEKDMAARTKLYTTLNPPLGRYIVSREPVPEQALQKPSLEPVAQQLPAGQGTATEEKAVIPRLTVGFDQSKLEPVMEALINSNNRDSENKDEFRAVSSSR